MSDVSATNRLLWDYFLRGKQEILKSTTSIPLTIYENSSLADSPSSTILKGAKRVVQSCDLLGLTFSETDELLMLRAWVHSKMKGKTNYLSEVTLTKGSDCFSWKETKFSCKCKKGESEEDNRCVHAVSLLFVAQLVQNLKPTLPNWATSKFSLGQRGRMLASENARFKLLLEDDLAIQYAWFLFEHRMKEFSSVQEFILTNRKKTTSLVKAKQALSVAGARIHFSALIPMAEDSSPPPKQRKQSRCRKCGEPRRGHKRGACPASSPSSSSPQPQNQAASTPSAEVELPEQDAEPSTKKRRPRCTQKPSKHRQSKRRRG